jgi:hypothetical protein
MRLKAFILLLMFSLGAAGLVHALSGTLFSDVITDGGCEGAFFDLRAESQDLTIIGFETVLVGTANVRVYYKPGTYAGSETNAGAWTLLGSRQSRAAAALSRRSTRSTSGRCSSPPGRPTAS